MGDGGPQTVFQRLRPSPRLGARPALLQSEGLPGACPPWGCAGRACPAASCGPRAGPADSPNLFVRGDAHYVPGPAEG